MVGTALLWWRSVSIAQAVVDRRLAEHSEQLTDLKRSLQIATESFSAALKETSQNFSRELKETSQLLQTIATQVRASTDTQGVINQQVSAALTGVCRKLDEQGTMITDSRATLSLMREFLTRTRGEIEALHAVELPIRATLGDPR